MNGVSYITKWLFNPFLIKKKGQAKVVVLCILAATTFWFLNAFNKTYNSTYNFPVKYVFDFNKYIPLKELPKEIKINITGKGWDLLELNFTDNSNLLEVRPFNIIGPQIISSERIGAPPHSILNRFQINHIYSDSLLCELDLKSEKNIKLILHPDSIKLSNGYAIVTDININPNLVKLVGPKSILDTISDNYNVRFSKSVESDFNEFVRLDFQKNLKANTNKTNIKFEIAPYIEMEKELICFVSNNSRHYLVAPSKKLKTKIYLPEKFVNSIKDTSIRVELDLKNQFFESDTFLKPTVVKKPNFVKKVVFIDSLVKINIQ